MFLDIQKENAEIAQKSRIAQKQFGTFKLGHIHILMFYFCQPVSNLNPFV